MYETIEFAKWLTGHDEKTIIQMYNDWKKNISFNNKVRRKLDGINMLNKVLKEHNIT